MTNEFRAIVARERSDGTAKAEFETLKLDDLPDYDVLVEIDFSNLNYKDGLAVSGKGKICRRLPMVCGIDLIGTVKSSDSADWKVEDRVLVNGFGLSETEWGGYSAYQRVKSEWLVKVPDTFSSEQAMGIGTAGYTAMLCAHAIMDHGVKPEDGNILVTGASGGVGSISTLILSAAGYRVVASTGRPESREYLLDLGAYDTINRAALDKLPRPLEKELWAAAVDSIGSTTLATALAQTNYGGVVAACGLAGGADLPSSVMPFILRNVTLRGIDSVMASQKCRQRAWDDLARYLDLDKLSDVYRVEPLSHIKSLANDIVDGRIRGRVVIDVKA